MIRVKRDEGISPIAKAITALLIVLTLVILAYQRLHRSEHVEPALRGGGPPEGVPPAEGTLPISAQKEFVTQTEPVMLDKK